MVEELWSRTSWYWSRQYSCSSKAWNEKNQNISESEMFTVLQEMRNNKSPGSECFTTLFLSFVL